MSTGSTPDTPGPVVAAGLSSEETKKLLHVIKHSKSVEIKVSVPMSEHRAAGRSMGLDAVEAEVRQVYFFDTADQDLNRAGLIVRARRRPGGRADTVIKRRPVDPAAIDAELKRSDSFKIEVDAMPDGTFVCSASYKGNATGQEVWDVADGGMPIRSLFSKAQVKFYAEHAPAGLEMGSLLVHGPILVLRAKHVSKEYKRGITVELWVWPDGKHILELSTKCPPSEAFQTAIEFRDYLADHGISITGKQETKTRTAMEKFKAEHDSRKRGGKGRRKSRNRR